MTQYCMRKAIKCIYTVNHIRIRISWGVLGAYQFLGPTLGQVNQSFWGWDLHMGVLKAPQVRAGCSLG